MGKSELKKIGVCELETYEKYRVNGGAIGIRGAFGIAGVFIYLYNNADDFVQGVKDGFNGQYNYKS